MKKMLLVLSLIGFSAQSSAQHVTFDWVHNSSTTDQAHAYNSSILPDGGVVTVGDFRTSCNLDPIGGTAPHSSNGGFDGFVQALDSTGAFKWSYSFGSGVTGILDEQAFVVAAAPTGDVYVAGRIRGTTVFQGANPVTLTCAGGVDVVFFKLNSNGQLQWAFSIGDNSNDMPTAIKVLQDGSVLLAGTFVNTVDFDPGSGTVTLSTGGTLQGFLANYDSSGNLNWAVAAEGSGTVRYESIDQMSNGNLVLAGSFSGPVEFKFLGNNISKSSPGGLGESYAMCLNPAGQIEWFTSFTPTIGNSISRYVAVDKNDNVYVGGYFTETIAIETSNYISLGSIDCFYVKLDGKGQVLWSHHGGSTVAESMLGVAARPDSGVIFLSYTSSDNFTLRSGSFPGPLLGVSGGVFFMMFDDAGNFVWTEGVDEMPLGSTFTMNGNGEIYFSGTYLTGQDFDFGPANTATSCSGSADMFVGRYKTTVQSSLSVSEIHNDITLTIYPNPATDKVIIEGLVGAQFLELLDANGKSLRNLTLNRNQSKISFDIANMAAGLYVLKVQFDSTITFQKVMLR